MARTAKKTRGFATGEDVAKLAGVSSITVSRVFNPAWQGKITEKTVQKVLDAAKQLKYRPNGVARSLANQKTDIIAVVMGQSVGYFYSEFLIQFVKKIQQSGRQVLVFTLDLYNDLDSILTRVSQHRVDAVVVTSSALRQDVSRQFEDIGIPVILFKRSAEHTNFSSVWCDELEGARKAARYLIKTDRRKIGVLINPDGETHRGDAFIDELKMAEIEPTLVDYGDYSYASGRDAARRMLSKSQLDAVFCEEDTMAMAFMDVARQEFKLSIPEDIAIIGFDNNSAAALPAYDITTLSHPLDDMIEVLIESIDYLMENKKAKILRCFPMELLLRSSAP